MADDDRRAEIEAVARAWWAHDPAAFDGLTPEWRALQMRRAEAAIAALDRFRDADDDLRRWLLHTVGSASSVRSAKRVVERLVADAVSRSPQGEDHEAGIPETALDAAEQAVHACRHYALGYPSRRALYVDARDEAYDVLAAALPYLAARSPQSNDEGHTKGCIQGEIDSECPCEAVRSSQDEDHDG